MQLGCTWKLALAAALLSATLSAQAAVTVTKTYLNPASAGDAETENNTPSQGDVRTLRIDVLNGGFEIDSGSLTDTLPTQMRVASPSNVRASPSCGAIVISAPAGGNTISYSGAVVPAQVDNVASVCSVYVDIVSTQPGNWDNTIPPAGFTGQEAGSGMVTNATAATRTLIVSSLSPLSVAKTFSPTAIRMGETSVVTITVTNPNANKPVVISGLGETLPTNITATGTATAGTCGAGTASGTSGATTITLTTPVTLAGSSSCTVTWTVRGNAANGDTSTETNTVPANSVLNDRGLTNTAATAQIEVQSPITLQKAFSQSVDFHAILTHRFHPMLTHSL